MFSQLFGTYLVEKQIITKDEYRAAIEKQLSVRVKLGTIAIADGLLSEEDVEMINQLQMQFDKRFGDIAQEKGLLTAEQIDALLAKQGNPYMQFTQSLTECTELTATVIDKTLAAFQKEHGFSDADMTALKADDLDALIPVFSCAANPLITELAGLVVRNINRFVSRDFYIGRIRHVKSLPYSALAGQKLTGSTNLCLALAEESSDQAFSLIAGNFSGVAQNDAADTLDAVCEFINVNNGLFASDQSEHDKEFELEPVFAYKDQSVEGDFHILPIFIEDHKVTLVIADNDAVKPGTTPYHSSSNEKKVYEVSADAKGSILVVDDSRMSRVILKNLLEEEGYSVVAEATNGEEAVEMFEQHPVDLVTLDITMPKMDGIEALQKILAVNADAKVIMITAAGQQSKVLEALKYGAKQFITKPFEKDVVLNSIKEVLGK